MRLDVIHPGQMLPNAPTDSGAPLFAGEVMPFSSVMPTANLPEDGHKTDDKHQKEKSEKSENEESTSAPSLPEIFKVILGRDFATILRFLSVEGHQKLFSITKFIQEQRGLDMSFLYPEYFVQTDSMRAEITNQYNQVVFYHYTRPGARFKGAM